MTSLPSDSSLHPKAPPTTWSAARLVACADACERLARLKHVSEQIAGTARECSDISYMAAALREDREGRDVEMVLLQCIRRCVALASACESIAGAAECVALCRECEVLCRHRFYESRLRASRRGSD